MVDKKYQCPKHCAVKHHHSVYYAPESQGMVIEEEFLGKKVKKKGFKKAIITLKKGQNIDLTTGI